MNSTMEHSSHKNADAINKTRGTVELFCALTDKALAARKKDVLAVLKSKVLAKDALLNGYRYQFSNTDDNLKDVLQFIITERACCPFFSFQLDVQQNAPIWLTIFGPDGTKSFLDMELEF